MPERADSNPRARRRLPLHTKILFGLIFGLVSGLLVHEMAGEAPWVHWIVANVANPVGQVFLRLIFMIVVPLVFSSLVLGCNGLLSGSGSVIADLQTRLFQAVRAGRLDEAKNLHDRITPTAEVFYAEPWIDMHNRMKEALVLLGRLPRAVVRPPLMKLSPQEVERIRAALAAAGLLEQQTSQRRVA